MRLLGVYVCVWALVQPYIFRLTAAKKICVLLILNYGDRFQWSKNWGIIRG